MNSRETHTAATFAARRVTSKNEYKFCPNRVFVSLPSRERPVVHGHKRQKELCRFLKPLPHSELLFILNSPVAEERQLRLWIGAICKTREEDMLNEFGLQ